MSEYIDTLYNYTPIQTDPNSVDLGFEDPFITADLTDPNSYAELFKVEDTPKAIDILGNLKTSAETIKSKFPTIGKSNSETISLPDLLKQQGINFTITSGYRPNAVTKSGHKSNHSIEGGAYDIKPANGKSFEDLREEIYSNPTIVQWMNDHGWGIIEETTPNVMAKTGATGKHWHFGSDSIGVQNFKKRLEEYNSKVQKGGQGLKFEDTLSEYNPEPPKLNTKNLLMFKDLLYSDDLSDDDYDQIFTDNTQKEEPNPAFPHIFTPTPKQPKEYSTSNNYSGSIPTLIHQMVGDKEKADILTQIAYNESGFRINAKNPKSSASGLFQFTNDTKQRFGYGNTAESQIVAASRLYDNNLQQLQPYVSKYGTKGKSLAQLMYGMWFNPQATLNYLKSGNANFTDAQGTTLNNIFNKMI